jgi:glucan phosphoethanolaminetransferase (alkaline phosphatase superfamily)
MNNIYYYFFFVIADCVRKLFKGNKEFAFSALCYITTFEMCNVLLIVDLFFRSRVKEINPILLIITIIIPIFSLNYFILMNNKKNEFIITFYETKYKNQKQSILVRILFLVYIVSSLLSTAYVAYLVRNNLL